MRKSIQWFIVFGVILFSLPLSFSSKALSVVQLNLVQLTELAPIIFRGHCTSVEKIIKDGRDVLVVTYKVDEVIKGDVGPKITFTQLAPPDPSLKEMGLSSAFEGMPTYKVGEEGMVFLSTSSAVTNLTAPIGLGQGRFRVKTDSSGQQLIVNDINNHGLFQGLKKSQALKVKGLSTQESQVVYGNPKKLQYGDFVGIVKKLAQ